MQQSGLPRNKSLGFTTQVWGHRFTLGQNMRSITGLGYSDIPHLLRSCPVSFIPTAVMGVSHSYPAYPLSKCGPKSAAAASPGNLLEIRVSGRNPKTY